MNIFQINKYVTCILMYKYIRGMLPNIFNEMFMKHTRFEDNISLNLFKTFMKQYIWRIY